MSFENNLVLFRYFLHLFGCEDFDQIRTAVSSKKEGYDRDGRSHFLDGLIGLRNLRIEEVDLFRYDQNIKDYVERLKHNRKQPDFNLKYFQYLATLFSEIFFDEFFADSELFVKKLNAFVQKVNNAEQKDMREFTEDDLRKIAFSVATGGGKTLLMHIHYWQFHDYSTDTYDNIILIPPNEGLSKQHYKELKKSGIPCKIYSGNTEDIDTDPGEFLVIDIHKLTKEKKGMGIRVDVSCFAGNNLVFVDEGHKGRKSEDEVWKKRREEIGRNGFIIEYSATFRQVIEDDEQLIEEYSKSILFEYSYKHFYTDGYGKDFYVYNIRQNIYSRGIEDLLLCASLLSFYEQLLIYDKHQALLNRYEIEKPLMAFIGGTVTGKIIKSDIPKIVLFFNRILENSEFLEENVTRILSGKSGLENEKGIDVFEGKFKYLKQINWREELGIEDLYQKVFRGSGLLELRELKNSNGEIGLRVSTSNDYFAVISVGNSSRLISLLEEDTDCGEDHLTSSLFFDIDKKHSPVNILVGSRKFMEGWDSWRVSCMGLLNMGKGKGPQIIQLFGRGVRLKGENFSLKREPAPDYVVKKLQTLFIFGLNADYINTFLEAIEREQVNYEERRIPIKFNRKPEWVNNLYTLKIGDEYDFREHIFELESDNDLLASLHINLRPRMTMAHGLDTGEVHASFQGSQSILEYANLIDWTRIYLEIMNYKIAKGYFNLIIKKDTLKDIIMSGKYKLLARPEQIIPKKLNELQKLEKVVLNILRSYLDVFYRSAEKRMSMDYVDVDTIDENNSNLDFEEIVTKIPSDLIDDFEDSLAKVDDFYSKRVHEIPTIHFDRHLYSPLAIYEKSKTRIKTCPVKLNDGETKFVEDLRNYLESDQTLLKDWKVFLLRNLSRKGIGFFQKTSGFYPDFILWLKSSHKQKMVFVDPKGIRFLGSFHDEKIEFCTSFIKLIEDKVKNRIKQRNLNEDLELHAFIVSVSDYNNVKYDFGTRDHTKVEFEDHNIVFQEEPDYIENLLNEVL